MASAAQHLATFGVSVDQARAFIDANINNPQVIFDVALQNGVTNAMLGEIAGGGTPYSAAEVESFFASKGINSSALNFGVVAPPVPAPGGGLDLFPEAWLSIASALIVPNNETGLLSNDSIRSQILANTNISPAQYFDALEPANWADDSGFDGDLLSYLGYLEPTAQTVESLIYGSIINVVRSIDAVEVASLQSFVNLNETALNNMDPGVTSQLLDRVANALSTPADQPLITDEELSQSFGLVGVALVGVFETGTLSGFDDLLMF